jgi:ankyrin repeat protein
MKSAKRLCVGQDEDGLTSLHWAADGGHAALVRALLEAGADVNAAVGGAAASGDWRIREL